MKKPKIASKQNTQMISSIMRRMIYVIKTLTIKDHVLCNGMCTLNREAIDVEIQKRKKNTSMELMTAYTIHSTYTNVC